MLLFKLKSLKYTLLSLGILVFLSSCNGCGCETVHKYGFDVNAGWFRFGTDHVFVNVSDYTYEQCPSLFGGGNAVDNTRYYALGVTKNEILDITEGMRQWHAMDDDTKTWGWSYAETPNSSQGPNLVNVGKFRMRIQYKDGALQTWILDPYAKPQMHQLGGLWGQEYLKDDPYIGVYLSDYAIRKWTDDTILIDLTKKRLEKMNPNIPHYYLQSLKTGDVSVMDFPGNNGGRWNDVVRFGDSIFTLRRADSITAYLYRFVGGKKDSLKLDIGTQIHIGSTEFLKNEDIYFILGQSKKSHSYDDAHIIALGFSGGGGFFSNPLSLSDWNGEWTSSQSHNKTIQVNDSIELYQWDKKVQTYPSYEKWGQYAK